MRIRELFLAITLLIASPLSANNTGNTIWSWNPSGGVEIFGSVGSPVSVASGDYFYVCDQSSNSILVFTGQSLYATISLGSDIPYGIAIDPNSTYGYVTVQTGSSTAIKKIELSNNTVIDTFTVSLSGTAPLSGSSFLTSVIVSLDGSSVYAVSNQFSGNLYQVDVNDGSVTTINLNTGGVLDLVLYGIAIFDQESTPLDGVIVVSGFGNTGTTPSPNYTSIIFTYNTSSRTVLPHYALPNENQTNMGIDSSTQNLYTFIGQVATIPVGDTNFPYAVYANYPCNRIDVLTISPIEAASLHGSITGHTSAPFGVVFQAGSPDQAYITDFGSISDSEGNNLGTGTSIILIDPIIPSYTQSVTGFNSPSATGFFSGNVFICESGLTTAPLWTAPHGSPAYGIVYETSSTGIIDTIVGTSVSTPVSLAYDPNTSNLFVANYVANTINVINNGTSTNVLQVPIGDCPHALLLTSTSLYVAIDTLDNAAAAGAASILIYNLSDLSAAPVVVGLQQGSLIGSLATDGDYIYATLYDGYLVRISITDQSVSYLNLKTGKGCNALAVDGAGTLLLATFVATNTDDAVIGNSVITAIDTSTFTVTNSVVLSSEGQESWKTGDEAGGFIGYEFIGSIVIQGETAYYANFNCNRIDVLSISNGQVADTGNPITSGNGGAWTFDGPLALAISEDGSTLAVTNFGTTNSLGGQLDDEGDDYGSGTTVSFIALNENTHALGLEINQQVAGFQSPRYITPTTGAEFYVSDASMTPYPIWSTTLGGRGAVVRVKAEFLFKTSRGLFNSNRRL